MSSYKCECHEVFDRDSGDSEGCIECIPCAAKNGHCECICDCGQCRYTDTPCEKPPSEVRCEFCELREAWYNADYEDPLSEVKPVISELELKITQVKDALALAIQHRPSCPPGGFSETYARLRLDYRLEPCLKALKMVQDKSAWAAAVIAEVKNLSGLEGQTVKRMSCGIHDCSCHLRSLNAILAEKMSAEAVALDAQILAAEDARHAARDACGDAVKAWEDAAFRKQVAAEMLEEAKWDTGMILISEWDAEMKTLTAAFEAARAAEEASAEVCAAAGRAIDPAAGELYRLLELKKASVA